MAEAYQCDGCKQVFKGNPVGRISEVLPGNSYATSIIIKDFGVYNDDLCPACFKDRAESVVDRGTAYP